MVIVGQRYRRLARRNVVPGIGVRQELPTRFVILAGSAVVDPGAGRCAWACRDHTGAPGAAQPAGRTVPRLVPDKCGQTGRAPAVGEPGHHHAGPEGRQDPGYRECGGQQAIRSPASAVISSGPSRRLWMPGQYRPLRGTPCHEVRSGSVLAAGPGIGAGQYARTP
jgi:hypothetical protein